MFYFDFMEKKTVQRTRQTAYYEAFSLLTLKTGTDGLFHVAVAKQRGASALKATDT